MSVRELASEEVKLPEYQLTNFEMGTTIAGAISAYASTIAARLDLKPVDISTAKDSVLRLYVHDGEPSASLKPNLTRDGTLDGQSKDVVTVALSLMAGGGRRREDGGYYKASPIDGLYPVDKYDPQLGPVSSEETAYPDKTYEDYAADRTLAAMALRQLGMSLDKGMGQQPGTIPMHVLPLTVSRDSVRVASPETAKSTKKRPTRFEVASTAMSAVGDHAVELAEDYGYVTVERAANALAAILDDAQRRRQPHISGDQSNMPPVRLGIGPTRVVAHALELTAQHGGHEATQLQELDRIYQRDLGTNAEMPVNAYESARRDLLTSLENAKRTAADVLEFIVDTPDMSAQAHPSPVQRSHIRDGASDASQSVSNTHRKPRTRRDAVTSVFKRQKVPGKHALPN